MANFSSRLQAEGESSAFSQGLRPCLVHLKSCAQRLSVVLLFLFPANAEQMPRKAWTGETRRPYHGRARLAEAFTCSESQNLGEACNNNLIQYTLSCCYHKVFRSRVKRLRYNLNSILECFDPWLAVPKPPSFTPAASRRRRGRAAEGRAGGDYSSALFLLWHRNRALLSPHQKLFCMVVGQSSPAHM